MTTISDEAIKKALASDTVQDQELCEVSLEEIEAFGNTESLTEMVVDIKKYNDMLKKGITFVNPTLTQYIPFTMENLYLICAYSGAGKSTLAANVSYPLWQQGKKTLILSNEESKQDVLFRVGCLHLGFSFNSWKKGKMPTSEQLQVMQLFPEISKYVKVLDVNYKDGFTTKIEAIQNALNKVKSSDYSCVMIDYFQLIQYSVNTPSKKRYDVLTDLWIWMRKYIKQSNIPIVLFAQLHSMGKRGQDLDARIKECPAVIEASSVIIEVIADFEKQTSDFIIQKDRFGFEGKKVTCMFKNDKYVDGSEAEINEHANRCKAEIIMADSDFKPAELANKPIDAVDDETSKKMLKELKDGKDND